MDSGADQSATILIVDDDPGIQRMLSRYLGEQGYHTAVAGDGKSMDAFLDGQSPDLIIMDLMLPGEDGLSLVRRLRVSGAIPIIMLTAKGEDLDRIIGLEMGADDYLAKPFNPRELLARIRAILRRGVTTGPSDQAPAALTRFGGFSIDLERQLLFKGDQEVALTNGEMSLLVALVQHPDRLLSRDQLMNLIGSGGGEAFDRSIDVRITRLRRKIEADPGSPQFIRTVWGQGYRFTPQAGKPD